MDGSLSAVFIQELIKHRFTLFLLLVGSCYCTPIIYQKGTT